MINEINLIEASAPEVQLMYPEWVLTDEVVLQDLAPNETVTSEMTVEFKKLKLSLPVVNEITIQQKVIDFLRANSPIYDLKISELNAANKTINECITFLSLKQIANEGRKGPGNTVVANKATIEKHKIALDEYQIITNELVNDDEIYVIRKETNRGDYGGYNAVYCYYGDALHFDIVKIGSLADKYSFRINLA